MKKILQDLSRSELNSLTEGLGEKKFRAEQIYLGLMQGKKFRNCPSLPRFAKNCSRGSKTNLFGFTKHSNRRTARKSFCFVWRTGT